MRQRDWPAARAQLERVVAASQGAALGDVARYELVQLELRAGRRDRAARRLDELLSSGREPSLREPAELLRCELRAQAGEANARGCFAEFRAAHPRSASDAAALGWLVRLAPPGAGCAAADEYLRRYPDGPQAGEARRGRERCAR